MRRDSVLGSSKEIKTKVITGQQKLNRWLEVNNVSVLDIKFSHTPTHTERFLVIYKENTNTKD